MAGRADRQAAVPDRNRSPMVLASQRRAGWTQGDTSHGGDGNDRRGQGRSEKELGAVAGMGKLVRREGPIRGGQGSPPIRRIRRSVAPSMQLILRRPRSRVLAA